MNQLTLFTVVILASVLTCFGQVYVTIDTNTGKAVETPVPTDQLSAIATANTARDAGVASAVAPLRSMLVTLNGKVTAFLTAQGVTGVTTENVKFKTLKWVNDQVSSMPANNTDKIAALTNCVQMLGALIAADEIQRQIAMAQTQ